VNTSDSQRRNAAETASAGEAILVVRLGAMGDIIHTLPAVASLKSSFPGARITWAVDPKWVCLVESNPYIDRLCPVNRRTWRGIRQALAALRRQRFSLAIDFQGLIKSALVARLARPARIVGFHTDEVREKPAALFYTTSVRSAAVHVVDKNLELAAAAGATNVRKEFPLPPGKAEGALPEDGFVLACPLAGWPAKQWPLEYYGALGRRLKQELGLTLVLNGPQKAEMIFTAVPDTAAHYSSVEGLIHATRRAAAVVGIDSGPLHLAAALGKPGVAIFGPTDPARNGPYGGSMSVLRQAGAATTYKRRSATDESMFAIHPNQVFDALRQRLATAVERSEFNA
jgi:lipopolysaccharide heptosyltransferase I